MVVPGLGQVALLERVLVDDQRPTGDQRVQIGLQRRGVHGHKHVRCVAGGGDVVIRNVDLEGRYPGHGAGGGPDLSGVFGQRGQVVAEHRAGVGEPVARQLHSVARVASEPNDDLVEGGGRGGLRDFRHLASSTRLRCLWLFVSRRPTNLCGRRADPNRRSPPSS